MADEVEEIRERVKVAKSKPRADNPEAWRVYHEGMCLMTCLPSSPRTTG